MVRHLALAVLVLAIGCRAQSPANANPEVNRNVERHVRAILQAPPYVKIAVKDRTPESEFAGYDKLTIALSAGERSQDVHFLISKDNKTLLSVSKIDLSKDPYAEAMQKIDVTGRPARGNKDAKVLVAVYDDFQCPYCSRMHQTINDTLKTYGDKIKVIYKDYPLFEIHPWAGRAAINSQCLADQSSGAYWDFADFVHGNPTEIQGQKRPLENQLAALDRVTEDIGTKHGVDSQKLRACIQAQSRAKLDQSVKEAESVGVSATPAVFINGMKLDGAVPAEQFKAALDQALADANATATSSK